MSNWGEQARFARVPHVVLSRTGDEAVLIDEKRGSAHVVNHTAAELWELCDGEPTVPELTEALADAYGVERSAGARSSVRQDVERMLTLFGELGLVESGSALLERAS
jgi:PqqD family protein of HPr-rel-A system